MSVRGKATLIFTFVGNYTTCTTILANVRSGRSNIRSYMTYQARLDSPMISVTLQRDTLSL